MKRDCWIILFEKRFIFKMPIYRIVSFTSSILQCSRSCPILRQSFQQPRCYGFSNITRSKHIALKREKEKLRTYVVQRYIDYVKNYTNFLEKRFPTAMNMYRVFSVGIKEFLRDLKTYISLRFKIMRDQGFSKLTHQDIELYQKMPSDMMKIAPVLILSAIPFGNYIIFPLAFWKPKVLLCSHFWSIQQRAEFSIQDLKERLKYNRPVFRALQAKLSVIPQKELKEKFGRIVGLLGSGVHPLPQEVLDCQDLFKDGPYQLSSLTYNHKGYLMKMHGLRKSVFRTNKLKYKAFLLIEMDKAILREGGTENMSTEALRNACRLRGLHDTHLTNKDLKKWLDRWLNVTKHLDKASYSLVLHCPIFFGYNHPQNWVLIY